MSDVYKFRDLTAEEIECRVSKVDSYGVVLLLYKDARCDQNILDETVGSMNWQRHHSRDNANCVVSIWDAEKKIWVEKEDTGTESNTEKEKGLASDSFKRACFNWGIGRELYTAPKIKIPPKSCSIEKDDRGKWKCKTSFDVKSISIENKRITSVEIVNAYTGETVYLWNSGSPQKETRNISRDNQSLDEYNDHSDNAPPTTDNRPFCHECGATITTAVKTFSEKHFGNALCIKCQERHKK